METNKYANGKIYKIISPSHPEIVYYGSTCQALCSRMSGHRRDFKADKPNSCQSKEILKHEDAQILLVEKFPCSSKEELTSKEAEYIRNNQCVNKIIPRRTQKEWRNDNKEKIKEYHREYREMNPEKIQQIQIKHREIHQDKIRQYQKEYRNTNKTEIDQYKKEYYQNNQEKLQQYQKENYENNKHKIQGVQKEYRENNKEKIQQIQKEYRENNKEKIAQQMSAIVKCECGKQVSKRNLSTHKKSLFHCEFITKSESNKDLEV